MKKSQINPSYVEYLETENKKLRALLITQQSLLEDLRTKFEISFKNNQLIVAVKKNGITIGEDSSLKMYGEKLVSVSTREHYHDKLKWNDTLINGDEKEYFIHFDFRDFNDGRPKFMGLYSTIIHYVFDWSYDIPGSIILRIYTYKYNSSTQQFQGKTLSTLTKPADLTKNDIAIFERALSSFCNNNDIKCDLIP